ncbi:DUF4127 family protein [Erysipelothrix anatis]|uniref:DUF4127 family protein n=1 Tax=Erysipelothrix anatis TaxID=2683713 RepID=UPI0013598C0B|nr:DUF4127 family protein [Erysipelothrix anatis]
MKQILILPIDDRPCHTDFILEATRNIHDVKVDMVPKSYLGHFTHAGDTIAIRKYLLDHCAEADTLVISIDALLFGGLVQSRTMDATKTQQDYDALLQTLRDVKDLNPNIKILAYSVIVRLTTTVTDSSQLQIWEDLFEYSQLVHRVTREPQFKAQLQLVTQRIPETVLADYLAARQRNHHFNKACVDLANEGILDYVSLVQEDTHEFGLHVREQEVLLHMIETYALQDCVSIKNGTDEMVALLVARDLNQNTKGFNVDVKFVDPQYIAKFEDRTIIENIAGAFKVANMTPTEKETPYVFLTLPATGQTIDLAFEPKQTTPSLTTGQLEYYERYNDKNLFVLDVQYGNGGDIRSLERLLNKLNNATLQGYSAWNTGSNSIGTLVLDLVVAMYYDTNPTYIKHRVIDDALYQGDIRLLVNAKMRDLGFDVWAENYSDTINDYLTTLLNAEARKYSFLDTPEFQAYLPWGRSFEVAMKEI